METRTLVGETAVRLRNLLDQASALHAKTQRGGLTVSEQLRNDKELLDIYRQIRALDDEVAGKGSL